MPALVRAALEPLNRKAIGQRTFITAAAVETDGTLDRRQITRSDRQLGIRGGTLT
ncbi:MAG: hypothetical protein LBV50_10615 [Novosphingobium sp.]|jgi:hypothetical protein|nr:hypothetical protein [Novosphingobium sp.]